MGNLLSRSVTDEVREALLNNNRASAAAIIQNQQNIPLNIAVSGESGSGKSSFVNAIRGLGDDDEGAAPTGRVENSRDVDLYFHPTFSNVIIGDLPGMGTIKFPAAEYLKKVEFEKFDFFIIISDGPLKENTVELAKEIQRMKKKFYFVRSKIDQDVRNEARKKDFVKEWILEQIRENCTQSLQEQGLEFCQVFLVSSHEPLNYDFPELLSTLARELPERKRDAFLLAMPNTSLEMIDRKKEGFQSNIKYVATLSAAVAAAPVPGLSAAVDIGLLVSVVTQYVFGFGLNTSSLKRMSNYTGVPYEDLKKVIKSPLAATKITPDLLLKTLSQIAVLSALMAAEEGSRFIPILGIPLSMGLSFTFTYRALNIFLNELTDDAKGVLQKALD